MTRVSRLLILASIMAALVPSGLLAQSIFERLVMPGPLIKGHADLEKKCESCHSSFKKSDQAGLCAACHKDVGADIAAGTGFHGRRSDIAKTQCKHCHTDHIGRGADIVQLDLDVFDHDLTDFQLKGRHRSVACASCHKAKVKFRDAPGECVACHKRVEPHKGRLGKNCSACHSEDGWKKTKPFDHDKTDFPLVGSHKKVDCKLCHFEERYDGLETSCIACHGLQDVHKGRHGKKCETCHTPKEWKSVRFDHDKDTKFPLRGVHATTKCASCHKQNVFKEKLSRRCISCHRGDDAHKGQLGEKCSRCHNETGWRKKVAFDHDLTRFPLIGLHAAVACEDCHTTARFRDAPLKCASCHRDKHHQGRLGARCARCHNPNGWEFWRFDHDTETRFALTGAHAGLECHACHTRKRTKRVAVPADCYSCHRSDDAHSGAFGRNCGRCHTTGSFRGPFKNRF